MAKVCTEVTEYIEEKVSKPIEEWEERQVKKCKKYAWYDPRGWVCWFVTTLVKVVRWIVVTVVTTVITIVCRWFGVSLGIFVDGLQALWNFGVALFTWDKCALQAGLAELGNALAGALTLIGTVFIRPFVDQVQRQRLRTYVGEQIDQLFGNDPDLASRLKQRFRVEHGPFGCRLTCTVHRMFVDSKTPTDRFPDVPNLLGMHKSGEIDLYKLAGFKDDCALFSKAGWYRPRHQTASFPFAGGGGLFGEPIPPEIDEEDLTEYIDSDGQRGLHFRIYAIHPGNLIKRLNAASDRDRQIGLRLEFKKREIEVLEARYINYTSSAQDQTTFLTQGLAPPRTNKTPTPENPDNLAKALDELCKPVAVAVFGFTDLSTRGLANNLFGTTHCADLVQLRPQDASGVSFIDDIPDEIRKYVLIHELGHYFGLCHVDGFERIMVSGKPGQGEVFTWKTIPNSLIHGGPRFTLSEAKRVWDFILRRFPRSCLDPAPIIT